jgi:galactokinase
MSLDEMRDRFSARFGRPCAVVARAPGRVNLIGEHTDYNDGFVLPIATEQETRVAAALRHDRTVRAYSTELDDEQSWPIDDWRAADARHWTAYVGGVAALFRQRGVDLDGFDLLIESDVPPGGGLSSSAALENATALALTHLARVSLEANELIDLCRRAEHDFAGVPCGLMDQSVSLLAQAGCAFLLDCRTREFQHIPCSLPEHVFVVIDSGVRHKLASSEYARRQQECHQAVEYFQRHDQRVRALRDVSLPMISEHFEQMERLPAARARHVVSENERTLAAAAALRTEDLSLFGRLMIESHRSLRDDYQVSCRELDQLVRIVTAIDGVLGARMTGGGFGGCVVALARRADVLRIEQAISEDYRASRKRPARLLRTCPSGGATVAFRDAARGP